MPVILAAQGDENRPALAGAELEEVAHLGAHAPAAFTLSRAPDGLRHVVLTRPGTKSPVRFTRPIPRARSSARPAAVQNRSWRFGLSVGSHVYGSGPCGPPCGLRSAVPVRSWRIGALGVAALRNPASLATPARSLPAPGVRGSSPAAHPSDIPSRVFHCPRLVVIFVHIVNSTGTPTGDFHPISSCPWRAYPNHSSTPLRGRPRRRAPLNSDVMPKRN